jgi:hypothetical protein
MIVSKLALLKDDPAPPNQPAATSTRPAAPDDAYSDIVSGAKVLRAIATALNLLGAISILIGAGVCVFFSMQIGDRSALMISLASLISGIMYAIPLFVVAALIRMLAAVGLAIRDIAKG